MVSNQKVSSQTLCRYRVCLSIYEARQRLMEEVRVLNSPSQETGIKNTEELEQGKVFLRKILVWV